MSDSKSNVNVEEILDQDGKYQEGLAAYKELEKIAHEESGRITQSLIERIVKKEDKFNISTAGAQGR